MVFIHSVVGEEWEIPTGEHHSVADLIGALREKLGAPPGMQYRFANGDEFIAEEATGAVRLEAHGIDHTTNFTLVKDRSLIVITGSTNGTVRLWDATAGCCIRTFAGHDGQVANVVPSPSGSCFVTTGLTSTCKSDDIAYDTAHIWCSSTGACLRTLTFPDSWLAARPMFSSDGTQVLIAHYDRDGVDDDDGATIWNASTGERLKFFHHQYIVSAAFSPDAANIVTSSSNRIVKIWNVVTGHCVNTLNDTDGDHHDMEGAVFSPDGGQVLTTSYSHLVPASAARLWNATSGDCVYTFFHRGGRALHAPSFSPDGVHVVFTCGDAAELWNLITGAHLRTFECHTGPVASVAFSPDGTKLLTSAKDDTAKIWDAMSGTCLQTLSYSGKQVEHSGVRNATFAPDGVHVLTTFEASYEHTPRLCDGLMSTVWNAATGDCVREFTFAEGAATAAFLEVPRCTIIFKEATEQEDPIDFESLEKAMKNGDGEDAGRLEQQHVIQCRQRS